MKLTKNQLEFLEKVSMATTPEQEEEIVDDFTFEYFKQTDKKPEFIPLPKAKYDGQKLIQTCLGYIKVKLV